MNRVKLGGLGAALAALIALLVALPMVLGRAPAPAPVSAPAPTPVEVEVEEELPTEAVEPEDPAPEQPPADPFVVPADRAPRPPQNSGPPPATTPTTSPPTTPTPGPTPTPTPTTPTPGPTPTPTTPTPTTPTPGPTTPPTPTGPRTVVSITFDDGWASQTTAASILARYGVNGTFYVNSGTIGLSGYLSRADLDSFAAAGNEIGGHSVTHPDLVGLPLAEITRQICDDRATLLSWGFEVRNFAYPFASANADVESQVAPCGYNSGRMLGDLRSPFSCATCDPAETIPPANPSYLRAPDQVENTWTLQTLQDAVVAAETTGGWLPFTFHEVCQTSCGTIGIPEAVLDEFVGWLTARGSTVNTVVGTTNSVIGGPVQPAVTAPAVPPPSPAGTNGIVNPSLETASGGLPGCWFRAPWGSNSPAFELTSAAHTGSVASQVTMTGYASGDAKILPVFDLGACAPSVLEGRSYSLRAWYASTAVTQFAVYLRTTQGGWVYWTSSPWFAATEVYTEAEWATGPIPAGYNGISFGLNIFADGVLVTDDYAIYDTVGAPPVATAPSTIAPLPVAPAPIVEATAADEAPPAEPSEEQPPAPTPPAELPPTAELPPATEPLAELAPEAPPVEQPPTPPMEDPAPESPPPEPAPETPPVAGDSTGT